MILNIFILKTIEATLEIIGILFINTFAFKIFGLRYAQTTG